MTHNILKISWSLLQFLKQTIRSLWIFSIIFILNRYAAKIKQCVGLNPAIFYKLLDSLLRIVLYTDSGNQWSLSKPILSLMLADQSSFEKLKRHYVEQNAISPEAQKSMITAFVQLTKEIRPNLEQGNRDRFSQHISQFRTSVLPLLKR